MWGGAAKQVPGQPPAPPRRRSRASRRCWPGRAAAARRMPSPRARHSASCRPRAAVRGGLRRGRGGGQHGPAPQAHPFTARSRPLPCTPQSRWSSPWAAILARSPVRGRGKGGVFGFGGGSSAAQGAPSTLPLSHTRARAEWVEVPGVHPLASPDDCFDAEAIVKADPEILVRGGGGGAWGGVGMGVFLHGGVLCGGRGGGAPPRPPPPRRGGAWGTGGCERPTAKGCRAVPSAACRLCCCCHTRSLPHTHPCRPCSRTSTGWRARR